MAIICCSKDDTLLKKIVRLYGDNGVIALPDMRLFNKHDEQGCEVVIVDLNSGPLQVSTVISLPTLALTGVPSFPEAVVLLQRGFRGYGNRQMRQDNLAQAIESVKTGQLWLPPSILTQLIASVGTGGSEQEDQDILRSLSEREQEVARCVARGMSNQQMADTMYISLRTVKAHLSSIYNKTGLRNRLELGLSLKKSALTV